MQEEWSQLVNFCESYNDLEKNSRWSEVKSIFTVKIKIAITQKNRTFKQKEKICVSYILMKNLFCEFDAKRWHRPEWPDRSEME